MERRRALGARLWAILVHPSESPACRCTRFDDGEPLAPAPEAIVASRWELPARRFEVPAQQREPRARRGEWLHDADPLPAPRCVDLAGRSPILARRHATDAEAASKRDADSESEADPETEGGGGSGGSRRQRDSSGTVGRRDVDAMSKWMAIRRQPARAVHASGLPRPSSSRPGRSSGAACSIQASTECQRELAHRATRCDPAPSRHPPERAARESPLARAPTFAPLPAQARRLPRSLQPREAATKPMQRKGARTPRSPLVSRCSCRNRTTRAERGRVTQTVDARKAQRPLPTSTRRSGGQLASRGLPRGCPATPAQRQ